MRNNLLEKLLKIGISLASEKSGDKFFEDVLRFAMEITNCDAGTLYIKNEDTLEFKFMITKSMDLVKGFNYEEITLPPVKIQETNVCAYSVLKNVPINIPDVYKSNLFDFSGPKKYDSITGYMTKSMMVIPMENNRNEIIGALQLINSMDKEGNVVEFSRDYEDMILALASQLAITLTNMNYSIEIRELMESIVETFSTVIYNRTPYNVTHTKNMVLYATKFIDWINSHENPWHFSEEDRRMFIMSVWLHDVGKLVTPLEIMNKETRLSSKLQTILDRFENIGLLKKINALENNYDCTEFLEELDTMIDFIKMINKVTFVTEKHIAKIDELRTRTYIDRHGKEQPWINDDEYDCLIIRKGTLTMNERKIMQEHVCLSTDILKNMKFKGAHRKIPLWASQHHEFLNGDGYPLGLSGNELDRETRLMTILDIFDGLSAKDRPYKQPVPINRVFEILNDMADTGQLDKDILKLFIESKAWDKSGN